MTFPYDSWVRACRPWLVLGRVSNLPTVWSNCLAGWLLSGGGSGWRLLVLWLGASLVYVGGMYLNDACDAEFDRRYRQERPIAMGLVGVWAVWRASGFLLGVGWLLLACLGGVTAMLAGLLVMAVVVYDFTHKVVPFSPVLMALCRYLLVLVASSVGWNGVVGDAIWSATVLGLYVVGLSYVARVESTGGLVAWWPLLGLLAPFGLAALMNPPYAWERSRVFVPALLLAIWSGRSLVELLRSGPGGAKACVAGLLAGIVFVDVLATTPAPWPWGALFLAFFGLTLVWQRRVPAT